MNLAFQSLIEASLTSPPPPVFLGCGNTPYASSCVKLDSRESIGRFLAFKSSTKRNQLIDFGDDAVLFGGGR